MNTDGHPQVVLAVGESSANADDAIAARRWISCAALVIVLHAALLGGLAPPSAKPAINSAPPPISIDLAPEVHKPETVSPKPSMTNLAPPVPAMQKAIPEPEPAPPKPERKTSPAKTPSAAKPLKLSTATALPSSPPQAVVPHQPLNLTPDFSQRTPTDLTAAPESENTLGELQDYRQVLTAYVIRHAVYPASALVLHQQGIVYVDFVVDRDGRILGYHLGRSSGIAVIDDEALAIFGRAQPFPAVPADLQAPLSLTMPFRFVLPR